MMIHKGNFLLLILCALVTAVRDVEKRQTHEIRAVDSADRSPHQLHMNSQVSKQIHAISIELQTPHD